MTNEDYRKQSDAVKEFAEKVEFMLSDSKEKAVAGLKKYGKDSLIGTSYLGEAFGIDNALFAIKFNVEQYDVIMPAKETYPTYAEFIKTYYWHSADNDIKIIGYEKFDGYDVVDRKLVAVKGNKVKILFNSEKGYEKAIKWLEDK